MQGGGLRRNLVSAIVTAIGSLVLVLLLLEDPLVQFRLRGLAQEVLSDATAATFAEASAAQGDAGEARRSTVDAFQRAASQVGAELNCRVTVIREGHVIADSAYPAPISDDLIEAEALAAFQNRGNERAALPDAHVRFAQEGDIVVQATLSTTVTRRIRQSVRELLILSGIMAGLVALFLTIVLGRTLVEPTRELTRVAHALASGDLSARTGSQRDDELGQIGRGLDRMADQLEDRINTLRAEEDRLRTVLNAMVEAVFVTDPLGRITQTNAAFDALAGLQAKGRTAREVFGQSPLHEAVRAARYAAPGQVEFAFERDGNHYDLTAEVAPLPDETGVVVVVHDVTSLRHADRVRRDFVANASHELRTPLTAIRGFAETLRDGAIHDESAAMRFLDVILKHTMRLDALVGDLAALSKAESPTHHLAMEMVDVQAAVVEVLRGLTSKAEERDVQFIFEPYPTTLEAWASHRGLDQVLVNLVDNAIKYTPEGSSVKVFLKQDPTQKNGDPGRITIHVHNPGPGIPAIHHGRLFERFYRVDPGRSRDVGGTGLGLAIVKHLCTQMGSEVGIKSAPGQGATFFVRLSGAEPSEVEGEGTEEDGPEDAQQS